MNNPPSPTFSASLQAAVDAFVTAQSDGTTPPDEIRAAITAEVNTSLSGGKSETRIIAMLTRLATQT